MIDSLNAQLYELQNLKLSQVHKPAEKAISRRIDDILRLKKQYLQQRSYNNWLKLGDRNSSFFHTSTNQR